MCIIQGSADCVESIFVAPLPDGKQLTVLSTSIKCDEKAIMIVPFPFPSSGEDMKILNLQRCRKIFTHMNKSFLKEDDHSETDMSYKVILVKKLDDFKYVPKDMFDINPDTLSILNESYNEGFSFFVHTLKPNTKCHPFGYVHKRLPDGNLFVPHLQQRTHRIYAMSSTISGDFTTVAEYPKSWVNFCDSTGLNVADISKVKCYTNCSTNIVAKV